MDVSAPKELFGDDEKIKKIKFMKADYADIYRTIYAIVGAFRCHDFFV